MFNCSSNLLLETYTQSVGEGQLEGVNDAFQLLGTRVPFRLPGKTPSQQNLAGPSCRRCSHMQAGGQPIFESAFKQYFLGTPFS
jgi:hypothetical protein